MKEIIALVPPAFLLVWMIANYGCKATLPLTMGAAIVLLTTLAGTKG